MADGLQATTRIEVFKESMKFSAAHFTIFSATERERLHGHNFSVYAMIDAPVGDNGMCFSYVELKDRLRALCETLDEYMVLPAQSPYLQIEDAAPQWRVRFADEEMYFLQSDCRVLPIRNSTVEEYSRYLLTELLEDDAFIASAEISEIVIKVSSGPGQSGSSTWMRAKP